MKPDYEQDNLKLYNADCMEVMKQYENNYFDLAVVDPPYGIGVDGNNLIANPSDIKNKEISSKDHKWDSEPPDAEYFIELQRVSKEQIIWGGNYFLDVLGYCKAPIIWDKLNGGSMYADGEMAWTSKGLPKNLTIWRHQWCGAFKDSERGNTRIHPTQKPLHLYNWIYANYAEPEQKILDTHLGSGSNAISAHYAKMGEFVGCELDEDYFKASVKRIYNETRQQDLF
jgi:site-specific DNA-methyltransferase (adenine-specific)